jgi:hypothetical protein
MAVESKKGAIPTVYRVGESADDSPPTIGLQHLAIPKKSAKEGLWRKAGRRRTTEARLKA